MTTRPSLLARLLMAVVKLYQLIPKGATPRCRFAPSCSEYALDALRLHGVARGLWLALRRLGRCHPFHPGGIDPVPAASQPARSPREGATA